MKSWENLRPFQFILLFRIINEGDPSSCKSNSRKKDKKFRDKNARNDGLDGIRTRGLHVANVTIYP